jgi:glycosyltransferase involved in cell wall biosynthesis
MDANRIRALYVQPAAAFGGAERQAVTNVPLLQESGVDVVAVVGPSTDILDWLEERGIEDYVHVPTFTPELHVQGAARLAVPWRYVRGWRRLSRVIEEVGRARSVDVIFAALAFGWIAATPAARKLGVPVVWRAGGTELTSIQHGLLRAATTLWRPDLLVCCSQAVRRRYEPILGAPTEVVFNGVDSEWFRPQAGDASRLRPPGARLVVGFAARMSAQKRPHDFVELAARLATRYPDVEFLAAGEGPDREATEALARQRGVSRLRFLGYVADMHSFYRACDIFVLPSRSEGAPNVVLEAMAMRRAVVASDVPATREIVRDGRDGFIVPIGDVDALERCVARLIEEPELRAALADSALERVRTSFSAQACARKTATLLRSVIDAPGSAIAPASADPPLRRSPPTYSSGTAPAGARGVRNGRRRTPGQGR